MFFFFQAEDGIRDGTVTGVQTCALPIYGIDLDAYPFREEKEDFLVYIGRANPDKGPATAITAARHAGLPIKRSEERRVGKGVDLGGRRIIKKKKTKDRV